MKLVPATSTALRRTGAPGRLWIRRAHELSPVRAIPAISGQPRRRSAQGSSPEFREIELAYMAKNVAPIIEEVDITPANYRFPAPTLPLTSAQYHHAHAAGTAETGERTVDLPRSVSSKSIHDLRKGHSGARWAANDPNDDDLIYTVQIVAFRRKNGSSFATS